MKTFTSNDFCSGNRHTKIARWLGLIFLTFMLGISQNNYSQNPCEISVTISYPGWGDAIEWELINGDGQAVLSGGPYGNNYSDTQTHVATTPPYSLKFEFVNTYCDPANYSVTVGGNQDISGQISGCGPINQSYVLLTDLSSCVPTCLPPVLLTSDNWTFSSAELSWTSSGNAFEIQYGESGFVQEEGVNVIQGITTTPYELTGLEPETFYQFYVRQDCGTDGLSAWAGPLEFYTGYCLTSSLNATTNFRITGFSTSGGYTNILNPNNGVGNYYSNFSEHSVILSEGESFDYSISVPNATSVDVWIDYNKDMLFDENELLAQHIYTTGNPVLSFTGAITIPSGLAQGEYRIRLRSKYYTESATQPCGTLQYGETEDYTLLIVPSPSCVPPANLSVDSLTGTSAELSWISDGTNFEIEYGASGFLPGEGILVTDLITDNSYILTGLNSETTYQYYVRRDCGSGNFSFWAGPYSFYTGYCLASSNSSDYYGITDFSTSGGYYNISNLNNGTANSYNDFTDQNVTMTDGGSFTYSISVPPYTNVYVWVDWNNNFIFEDAELVGQYEESTFNSSIFTGTIIVPLGTPEGEYRMRIRSYESSTLVSPCGTLPNGEVEDYTIEVFVPSCLPPTELGSDLLTFNSAELFWSSEGNLFEIEYGESGFILGNGISETGIVSNSHLIENLTAETFYQYYVRRDCGGGDLSFWTGPYEFYTGYCLASSQTSIYSITSFTTTGGLYNISNYTGLTPSSGGYGDFTSQSVHHFETGAINFTLSTNPGLKRDIWVDWNNDLEFSEDEKVYTSSLVDTNSISGSILIPFGTPVGDYRIRIRAHYEDLILPCGSIVVGETEDYTLTVITPPSCLLPFTLTSENISSTSTLLEWESNGDLFDIEYGLEGFTLGTGILIPGVSNPYTLEGLTDGTTYEYYVRQDCGTDGISDWGIPVTFTAGIYQQNIPTMLNANPNVEDNACAVLFSIEVPDGQQIAGLNLQYIMVSSSPAYTNHQRSVLYSPTIGLSESQVVLPLGGEDYPGFLSYNRTVDFANGATGTVDFELKAWRTEGGSDCDADLVFVEGGSWILNATFEDIPTCPNPPADLGYTNIAADSVDLIWASDETGTFQIKWGDVGFNDDEDDEGTTVSDINGFTHTLSGLDSSIPYEYYVRRDCSTDDEEDFGEWAGPVRFNSGHCIPYATQGFYFTTFVTTNALDNITYSYTDTDLSSGYVDKTDMVISQEAGASFNFTSNYVGTASGLRIWVDWNNDFVFGDDEEVYFLANTSGTKSGIITIPSGTIPGDYRIRVRAQSGATATPPACGLIGQGEVLDFTLNVACVISIPTGDIIQGFTQGQTLSDLDVTGTGLVWYADEDLTIVLDESTELVHDTTYYVVSTNDYCQSEALAITVESTSGISDFNSFGFRYYPNPVSELLYLSANASISDVTVINMLGQKINVSVNSDNTSVDMSGLPTGNYLIKVTVEGISKTFKVVKQ